MHVFAIKYCSHFAKLLHYNLMDKNKESGFLNYNPYFDGLKGIAILMVTGYHYFGRLYIWFWLGRGRFISRALRLFINREVVSLHIWKGTIIKIYINRFLRIFPLYFLNLIVFLAAFFLPMMFFLIFIVNTTATMLGIPVFYKLAYHTK